MSGTSKTKAPAEPGPPIPEGIDEVYGVFRSDAALQVAIELLEENGFDRADMSLPVRQADPARETPESGAINPNTDSDKRQERTLHASMAGSVGALAAAGVTVLTGGAAAAAAVAAVAAGVGAGALAEVAVNRQDAPEREMRERAAAAGELVLSVRITSPERSDRARDVLRRAGAAEILEISRRSEGIDSARWTG